MSMISESRPIRGSFSQQELPFAGFLQRMLKGYQHRRALQRLLEMEDHILADMGLTRDDVRYAQAHIPAPEIGDYLAKAAKRST